MKAYLITYGYEDEYGVDSVFLNKEKAEEYVSANNQIPFDKYNKFHIKEVELNPSVCKKSIVTIYGYINKNKKIKELEIDRVDRDDLKNLTNFSDNDILMYPVKLYGEKYVTCFDGMIDVTQCKDMTKCYQYIKDIVMKKYYEYKNES